MCTSSFPLFYLHHLWPPLSPKDLWLSNSRHRNTLPRFWVRRHSLQPQLSVMLGKHEPLNSMFSSIGSLYHNVWRNAAVLNWYEMVASLFLLYGKPVSDAAVPFVSIERRNRQYVPAMHSSSVFLFAASLSSAEQLRWPLHTPLSPSHLSDGSWISLDFLLPMKLEGTLFISFLLRCEMGFTPANMNLTLTFDSTVTWLSRPVGLPWPANLVSPLQISLLRQPLLPPALTCILWTVEGLTTCRYFCSSSETPCGPFSLFF